MGWEFGSLNQVGQSDIEGMHPERNKEPVLFIFRCNVTPQIIASFYSLLLDYLTFRARTHIHNVFYFHGNSIMSIKIEHTKQPLFTKQSDYKGDPELFKQWEPKIKAYNEARESAIPLKYLAPETLIPTDLDTTGFNATTVPLNVLDAKTLEITSYDAPNIAKKIKAKQLSAVEVTTAFIKRATIAHQLTNCMMEVLFDDALKRAQELDDYYEKTGEVVGPLHGVPISLKEHYAYEGRVTTAAYVSLLDNVTPKFALTLQVLYDSGAVFFCRTNEPQCLMHLDSVNNITPRCRNAYNTSLSPGGSSSGEGAIIGMGGSILGVGSDIGGSIRAPAAFNNIWGLKPTTKRISLDGVIAATTEQFQDAIGAVLGPMANSADGLDLFMKAYIAKRPWEKDQYLVPLPWRDTEVKKQLTIGIVYDDGVVKPHPPVLRAMKTIAEKLTRAGVDVVEWEPHRVYEAVEVCNVLYTADSNHASKSSLGESGEPLVPLTEYYLTLGKGDNGPSVIEYEMYWNTREQLRQEYLDLFNERKVDFVLAPTYVGTAPKPSTVKYWGYTSLWNILDFTAVTFPSGIFSDSSDKKDEAYVPRNKYEEYEYGLYEEIEGMPVGVTLVGRRYVEEEAIATSKYIHEILTK